MINPDIINAFADGCKPRVLVVTDMFFQKGQGFSLSQFVDTLKGMDVTLANLARYTGEPEGTLLGFKFDDQDNGLSREKYDVCFIFTFEPVVSPEFRGAAAMITGIPLPLLQPSELTAIKRFMEEGGGVFATGDHEDLGARTCKDIPRVNSMRKWTYDQGVPSAGGEDRLSTVLSGDDEMHEFADESDVYPQRVYLNRRTDVGGLGNPHPLMQAKESGRDVAIVHIPDHPHEGECIIPENLETEFQLDGENRQEWPLEIGSEERVSPEIVAKSMSAGGLLFFFDNSREPKDVPIPREFIAIAAYDGHRAGVGRVVTDATWHHFLNINIDGTGSSPRDGKRRYGLMLPPSDGNSDPVDDSPVLIRLRQHWRNLAEWLMPPQDRRRCAAVIHIADALPKDLDALVSLAPDELGQQIKMNLDRKLRPYQVNDLVETVLAMGISDPKARKDITPEQRTVALGAFAAALAKQNAGDADEVILANLAEAVKASLQP
jgi:hypothetical protein